MSVVTNSAATFSRTAGSNLLSKSRGMRSLTSRSPQSLTGLRTTAPSSKPRPIATPSLTPKGNNPLQAKPASAGRTGHWREDSAARTPTGIRRAPGLPRQAGQQWEHPRNPCQCDKHGRLNLRCVHPWETHQHHQRGLSVNPRTEPPPPRRCPSVDDTSPRCRHDRAG